MKFLLSSRHRLLHEREEIPFHYRSYRVPGAQPLYVKGDFGDYLTQIITSGGCSIQLNLFRINKAAYLHPCSILSVLPLHFMLENNIRCGLEGFGEAWLRENYYNLFYVPGGIRHHAWLEPGFHRSFHIDFSPAYLQQLAAEQDELREVNEKLSGQSAKGVQQHSATITPLIIDMINTLLYDRPAEPAQQEVFIEITAKALLLKYVQDMPADTEVLSGRGIRLMNDVLDYVRIHLDYPHTVHSLSQRYGMSETVFRKQFVQYTRQSFRRFLLNARMKMAMKLVKATNQPIRDIALRVGYREHSNFDRAFFKKFGHAPLYYRS